MYKKVLLIEDLDTIGYGIVMMLKEELQIEKIDHFQYCNEAYLKFKNAHIHHEPYDLIITDLAFIPDDRMASVNSGEALIISLRNQNYSTPIIICSVEEKAPKIKRYLEEYQVSGYVSKGRNGLKELKDAVKSVYQGNTYISPHLMPLLHSNSQFELKAFDVSLITI